MNDKDRQKRNSLQENPDCDQEPFTSILVECHKPDALTRDIIKCFFQRSENGGSYDVTGVIYPFRGNKKQAAVIFHSPESASCVYRKSHADYTVKPLKTSFSEVCATIDNQQWTLLANACAEVEYYVQEVVGACMSVEGSESVRTVVGTQLQIEEVDRFLRNMIENRRCTVRQHSATEVSDVPSANAQDLTNQLSFNDGAPSFDLIVKAGNELESSAAISTGLAHSGQPADMFSSPKHFQTAHAPIPCGLQGAAFEMFGTNVHVYKGDLTKIRVNAVLNPANRKPLNHSGAALAISETAGKEFDELCESNIREHGELSTGGAVGLRASGMHLQRGVEHVINCVGPAYYERSDDNGCREVLALTVFNCLKQAEDLHCASMAVPVISSGIYSVPLPICTEAYVDGVCRFFCEKLPLYLRDIYFVVLDEYVCDAIREEFARRLPSFLQGIATRSPETHSLTSATSFRDDKEDRWWEKTNSFVSQPRTTNASYTNDKMFSWQRAGSPTPSAANSGRDARSASRSALAVGLTTDGQSPASSFAATAVESVARSGTFSADNSMFSAPAASAAAAAARSTHIVNEKPPLHVDTVESLPRSDDSRCPICLETVTDAKTLPCSHTFCSDCVNHPGVKSSALCPVCRVPFGTSRGNQPQGGTMTTEKLSRSLPGYRGHATIKIQYSIPSGVQNASHPNPGRQYSGTNRTAYLPDNSEGRDVLRLLTDAFNRGLTFTIGTSHTTGQRDCVVWNDIHHKTATDGGPTSFGYPDPDYLKRVKEELAAKGVR